MPANSENKVAGLVDHLFRHQAGQMVSTLTRVFGPRHLDLAEEVVQDALLKAMQLWPYRGIPENPAAWLVHYYLLPATLGELWCELGETEKAVASFRQALSCSCSEPERRFLQKKLAAITDE